MPNLTTGLNENTEFNEKMIVYSIIGLQKKGLLKLVMNIY